MVMYCACGQRKTRDKEGKDSWICRCDWKEWTACFKTKETPDNITISLPTKNGIYQVRVFEDGDNYEDVSEFDLEKKNWGNPTNKAISNWKITYDDGWTGYKGVYAWKRKEDSKNG